MLTEVVLLKFIFWEIWCHTGYPTESLDVSTRKMDVDFPFCLLRGKVRGKLHLGLGLFYYAPELRRLLFQ